MILGTGIDIVEIDRFKKAVKKYEEAFLKRIFTDNEISYSRKKRFSDQHFAARFATKEAVLKAFGDRRGMISKWTDIEVLNDKNGRPFIALHGSAERLKRKRKVDRIVISMAHSRGHAVANAILISG